MTKVASSVDLDARFAVSEHVHCRRFDDEVVVLDLQSGDYFALNETAARIWEGLTGGRSPREMVAEIAGDSEEDVERVAGDCVAFVSRLLDEGWVTLR
jgi:hypothetical protein